MDEKINQAKKKLRVSETANKVQLMRIKNKASGLKTIPAMDRVYFNVTYSLNGEEQVKPIFVSKTWSLGTKVSC